MRIKFNAWTMMELIIVLIVIMLLSTLTMKISKNVQVNKTRIYLYAAMKNLNATSVAILDKNADGGFYPEKANIQDNDPTNLNDWYCQNVVDVLTTQGTVTCKKNAIASDVNFALPSGTTFQGLSMPWVNIADGFYYKNIAIDIDGTKGSNKVGIDRFPVRIFRGMGQNGLNTNGLIYPVNCASDKIYDQDGNAHLLNTPYCNDKFDATGTKKNYDFANDNTMFVYDIYKVTNAKHADQANVIIGKASSAESDCRAHGGHGFYSPSECKKYGYLLEEICAHEETCKDCDINGVCPENKTLSSCNYHAEDNKLEIVDPDDPTITSKQGFRCITLISAPTGGLGLLGNGLLSNVGL